MPFYPLHLEPLLLLGLLPFLAIVTWKSLTTAPGPRKWMALAVRCGVLFLLLAALADLRFPDRADRLSVIYLLDHSASIPTQARDQALGRIRGTLNTHKAPDTAGLVVFGRNASIENVPELRPEFAKVSSVVSTDYTDIGGAIRLATAAFPQGTQRRLVLVSDGNENVGNAIEEARRAAASGVSIDVLPVIYTYGSEVQLKRVVCPSKVKKGETFEVRIIVTATKATEAKIYLSLDRAVFNEPRPVLLSKGKNVFVHTLALNRPGFLSIQARVEAQRDTVAGNNAGYAFTIVEGEPRVLLVGDTEDDVRFLSEALAKQQIPCEALLPSAAPLTPAGFGSFDCVVVANVPANRFTPKQMEAMRASVVNFGVGMVFVGGDRSYGAGGYFRTPVEDILPLSCEVRQKKVLPNGALVLILHTCEFADGNTWAKKIAFRAIERLTERDLVGFIYYAGLGGSCSWLFKKQLIAAKSKADVRQKIQGISPGDMPEFEPGIRMAYKALKNARAAKKHILIISDGDPQPPSTMLVRALSRTSIAVSTVLINPHSGDANAVRTMRDLAVDTGGRFYQARDGRALPDIIMRVARVVSTNFIKEETFVPVRASASDLIKGFGENAFPALEGRVITSVKGGAEVALKSPGDDPVLAHWRAGLGRTAAFTSDAKNRWGKQWVAWDGFSKFWGQTVRWCMRTVARDNFHLQAVVSGGRGIVTLDALDPKGRFVNFLRVRAKAITPSFAEMPLHVTQKGPGRYEGEFRADEVGAYYVSLVYEGDGIDGFLSTGASLSYSPEYSELSANLPLLTAVAETTGGRILAVGDDVFLHNLPRMLGMEPRWPLFLVLGLFLFLLDVTVRRVVLPFDRVGAWAMAATGRVGALLSRRRAIEPASTSAMSALLHTKSKVSDDRQASALRLRMEESPPPESEVNLTTETSVDEPPPAPKTPALPSDQSLFMKRLLDAKRKAFEKKEKGTQP